MSNKKAAMEMSVGTIVTIVLLMTVLTLGVILVKTIFRGATESVGLTDKAVKDQINKLFSEDKTKKIYVVPPSRQVEIKKGISNLGFGFLINNVDSESRSFSYEIEAIETSCPNSMSLANADKLIALGRQGNNIVIPADSKMEDEIFVRFEIPDISPACQVRYQIQVFVGGKSNPYTSPVQVDVNIVG